MDTIQQSQQDKYDRWYKDPANWKAGFIYANSKDKRILVPKKLGIGYTFNMGNPIAILLVVILIGIPLGILIAGML